MHLVQKYILYKNEMDLRLSPLMIVIGDDLKWTCENMYDIITGMLETIWDYTLYLSTFLYFPLFLFDFKFLLITFVIRRSSAQSKNRMIKIIFKISFSGISELTQNYGVTDIYYFMLFLVLFLFVY